MRVDHHAYRRATGVAGFGFMLQAGFALTLFFLGRTGGDTVLLFASACAFGGLLVWLSLIAVFYQHRQERLEALEEDELAAARGGSVFQAAETEKPAARRLRLMHRWLMPLASLLLAGYLALAAWLMLRHLGGLDEPGGTEFSRTPHRGWAVAVCISFAIVGFIFSRFVAGMARQAAWQNLRGGAGTMVGSALVMLAVTVGIIVRFFGEGDQPLLGIAWAIPVFMIVLAAEIVFNFVLNLYRPRVYGEVPRPAFDSRLLSLLAAPESIVQSISDAVNYQFGFDITSSWGYQLLLRSFGWLIAFGVAVLVVLNMMVVVEPHQEAVKLSGGRLIGAPGGLVHGAGIMWKLPWPLQTAAVYDVKRVREMELTPRRRMRPGDPDLWSRDIETEEALDPFIVGSAVARPPAELLPPAAAPEGPPGPPQRDVSDLFALVDAEITLQYRIRDGGLLDYLRFASDDQPRRRRLDMRESALRSLALREITQSLSRLSLEEVISHGRADLVAALEGRIQGVFDAQRSGVEVVRLNVPMLRPAGAVAKNFEDLTMALHQRQQDAVTARGQVVRDLTFFVGRPEAAPAIVEALEELYRARGGADADVAAQRQLVERLLADAGGALAQEIARARAERWIRVMDARARATEFRGQLAAYRTAPELFRQREYMQVLSETLGPLRKYIFIGIDPEALGVDVTAEEALSALSLPATEESEP